MFVSLKFGTKKDLFVSGISLLAFGFLLLAFY